MQFRQSSLCNTVSPIRVNPSAIEKNIGVKKHVSAKVWHSPPGPGRPSAPNTKISTASPKTPTGARPSFDESSKRPRTAAILQTILGLLLGLINSKLKARNAGCLRKRDKALRGTRDCHERQGIGLRAMPADLSGKVGHLAKLTTPCGGRLPSAGARRRRWGRRT